MNCSTSRSLNLQKKPSQRQPSSCQTIHGGSVCDVLNKSPVSPENLSHLQMSLPAMETLTLHLDKGGGLFGSINHGLRFGIKTREELEQVTKTILQRMEDRGSF